MGKKYIHYGHDWFIPEYFVQPSNDAGFTKPRGGLWASPVDSDFGWADWCEFEDYNTKSLKKSFTFELTDDANVLLIEDRADYMICPHVTVDETCWLRWPPIDFEELLRQGVDAVEVRFGKDFVLPQIMRWWDCDSIVVLNPDVIVEVE